MIKINFRLANYSEMMNRYKELLTYIKSAVTRNHSEKSINSILDYISTSKQMELLQVRCSYVKVLAGLYNQGEIRLTVVSQLTTL